MLRSDRIPALNRWVRVLVGAILVAGYALWANALFDRPAALPADDSVAAGFARDMSVHHAQAVEMAEIIRDRTNDDDLRLLATDIALTQQAQIGRMRGWLDVWDLPRTGTEPAMSWMGLADHGAMPGMAERPDVDALRSATIASAEVAFLELMIAHHEGGVAMAESVRDRDIPDEVGLLADSIVTSQQSEIDVMRTMLTEREEASA